jgi:putative intracellular protease/amidase
MPDGTSASILIVLDVGGASHADPLEDFAGVYYALLKEGARLLIASEAGGYPWPQRPTRGKGPGSKLVDRFLSDRHARDDIADTLPLRDVFVEDFEACILVGGNGSLAEADERFAGGLIGRFLKAGKPVTAISGRIGFMPSGGTSGLALLSSGGVGLPAAIRALLAALRDNDEPGDPR